MKTLFKALIGSQAHGLAGPDSDYDWRGVFVEPTSALLSLGGTTRQTSWIEGKEDDTSWELGHFLFLATKCNPSVLEIFRSSTYTERLDPWAEQLLALWPHLWNSRGVRDAYKGYGHNQRKKFLERKDDRPNKYAVAYLRTLYNAWEILTSGDFHLNVAGTELEETLRHWRAGLYTYGSVIDLTQTWEWRVDMAYERNPNKQTDLAPVNDFLLRARKAFWHE